MGCKRQLSLLLAPLPQLVQPLLLTLLGLPPKVQPLDVIPLLPRDSCWLLLGGALAQSRGPL